MPQILKDLILISVFLLVILMFSTMIINLFFTKAPYVPSSKKILDNLLEDLKLKPKQKVYDLGCSDGRFLIRAEKKFGIQGIGYELAPLPFLLAQVLLFFTHSKSQVYLGNFFKQDLSQADIIFCYLFPEIVTAAYHKAVKECQKGTIFISNTFSVKDVQPDRIIYNEKKQPQLFFYYL